MERKINSRSQRSLLKISERKMWGEKIVVTLPITGRRNTMLNLVTSEGHFLRKEFTNCFVILQLHVSFFVDFPSSSYRSALRNWLFQVSKDGKNWTTLYTHTDDNSLNEPGYDI